MAAWSDEVIYSTPTPVVVSTTAPVQASTSAWVTMVFPLEGAKLPPIKEVFAYGAVVPGSTLTINSSSVPVHPKGGYLVMVPLSPGNVLLNLDTKTLKGETAHLERRFSVAPGFVECPPRPLTIVKESVTPQDDMLLSPGDMVRASFQGTPQGTAEFSIEGVAKHIPMTELGSPGRGVYEGSYVIPPTAFGKQAAIIVSLKRSAVKKERAKGRLTIASGSIPRVGTVLEDIVATRTAPEGGYDVFLYKGMKVRLTGKIGSEWRVRFSASQTGWVKEAAILELAPGTLTPQSMLSNMTIAHEGESTLVKMPLSEVLPFRTEESTDPMELTVTLFGATDKTDLIRHDPADPLVQRVRWRQTAPDTCQIIVEPKFRKWWGYDVRYEGSTLVIEIRKPWTSDTLKDMVIAVDPGHGGSDNGAIGPHGTFEKDANLAIAKVVADTLQKAGAKAFLTRTGDFDVPLYERGRIAWKNRARLFVSIHCNAAGLGENPLLNNGSSVYYYQPQSQALAESIHAGYRKHVGMLPDHGLFYADLAVCRITQMPAVLTEQAFIILPAQEALIFDAKFQKNFANAIVSGIKNFVKP